MPRLAPGTAQARPFRPGSMWSPSSLDSSERLDLVGDRDLGLAGDQLVDRALTRDDEQALALLVAELARQPQSDREGERRGVAILNLHIDLDLAHIPTLAL